MLDILFVSVTGGKKAWRMIMGKLEVCIQSSSNTMKNEKGNERCFYKAG